ncbi:hypothetical protein BDP27DRAFT_1326977 [Rhodocollybia butyracea]|uniref:Uncharacterized protein n=1 Tax=Rhodocollybia butyracea TaxID=206335 RepID=A0A9P5PMG3_9AGAR|nr:hypothetical protein BDP27DRAFT_1326977 [Rhodocollybia butyracea]
MIHQLTGLGARASPTPNPPSAWNTFGRRKSRMHNSIPHISDFGASPDVSLSSSQRSRASSQPAETSADLSGSFSGQSLQSVSPPHSRSQSYTPSEPRYSPPSTGFTFGSIGPAFGQSLTPPVPLNLALRFNLGGGMRKATEGQNEVKGSMNLESLSPRPSASMPSLSRHRHLESLSNDGYDNPTSTGPSRPRAQDIFPASSSSDELHRGHRRHRKDTNRSTGSSNNSKPRRYTRREALPPTSAGFAPVPDSFLCETRVNNVSF